MKHHSLSINGFVLVDDGATSGMAQDNWWQSTTHLVFACQHACYFSKRKVLVDCRTFYSTALIDRATENHPGRRTCGTQKFELTVVGTLWLSAAVRLHMPRLLHSLACLLGRWLNEALKPAHDLEIGVGSPERPSPSSSSSIAPHKYFRDLAFTHLVMHCSYSVSDVLLDYCTQFEYDTKSGQAQS